MRSRPDPTPLRRASAILLLLVLLAALLLVLLEGRTGPKPSSDPSLAALLEEGERLADAGENQQAWEVYERARSRAQAAGDRSGKIAALVGMGDADPPDTDGQAALAALAQALELGQGAETDAIRAHLEFRRGVRAARREELEPAEKHFESALGAARRGGDRKMESRSFNALANIDLRQNRWPQAGRRYQAALSLAREIGYSPVLALAERGLGDVAGPLGDPEEALRHYEAALEHCRALSNRRLAGSILNQIGAMYLDRGDYGKALRYCQEALRSGTDNRDEIAYALNNLGIIFAQANSDLAVAYFQKSLRIAEERGDGYTVMRVLHNLGETSLESGTFGPALEYKMRALRLAEEQGDEEAMAGDWRSLAMVYQVQGRHDLANRAFRKSLALARSTGKKNLVGQALAGLADLQLVRKDPAAALELAGQAAAAALESGDRETFWGARTSAGTALRALGRNGEAERAFGEAMAMVEEVRTDAAGGQLGREGYLGSRLAPYQRMVELAAQQGDAAAALGHAERVKARTLIDTLRDGRGDLASPLTPGERATEQRLRERLSSLNAGVFRARSEGDAPPAILANRDEARRELEAFTLKLYARRSDLRLRRTDFPTWSLAEARPLLAGGATALLEYAVLDDQTFLWTVTADSADSPVEIRMHRLRVGRKELAREAEAFRRRLGKRDLDFQGSARRLYDLVLAPAASELQGKRALVIVPDGPLWDLPFQALQTSAAEVLLERHALSYAPSLSFLAELAARKPAAARDARTLLAVGNPALTVNTTALASPLRGRLARLPEAEQEVEALSQLYGSGRSAVYTASRASESTVKAEAGKFRVLHFATHALLDDDHPLYSGLVFSQAQPANGEDGLLEAWEILDLHLDADLVVLSACQTARGRTAQGEGMTGLSWALAVAGSSATVASQWEVDSASTAHLMVELHRQWLGGASKAEALRRAALAVRRQDRYRHPFYWGAFVLVGDGA